MSDVTSSFSPASAVAAPALRKRFFEAHRFLSRAAQFPLVLAKLYRDGIDHPQFFSTLGELLPLDRLCFCIWDESEPSEPAWLWSWEANNPPMTEQQAIPAEVIQLLRKKPLRINEFEQELGEEVAVQGAPLWGGATRSMVTIPLHQAGAFLGFALFCANQAATYNDGEMAHAQLLGDALAPMLRLRLMKDSQLEQQQSELRTLELEREVTEGKLGDLQKKLGMIEAESNLLEERAETLEREKFEAQKRLQTAIGEKNRLLAQLQAAKEERDALRLVCASYEETAHHVLEDAEQIRQHLLHTHRSASMLRQLAEQRLQDSTQRSMAQTELVLDASSQMIPEALNSLNHLNSLQDLSFGELNSRQQRFVRFSLRSVKYISQLLSELNDYNRCLLGKLPLNPEPIVFAHVFADVQVKFQPHIKQKRLKVDVSVDSPGAVMADSYIAQQAVYTLMEHAVDATPISGTIAISASSNDDSVVLALEHDSELELLKDDLEQLFIPFQRPDFDPDDDIPPGLALPLARELISFHHGEINVVQKGQRLCFTIEWPKELTPEQQEEAASSVSFSPLISLPPLAEEWETPLVSRYDFPALPPAMPSSDFLPASSSQSGLPSASSSNLPQPPSSLSSRQTPTQSRADCVCPCIR
jgi:signal transduction histidine kinase